MEGFLTPPWPGVGSEGKSVYKALFVPRVAERVTFGHPFPRCERCPVPPCIALGLQPSGHYWPLLAINGGMGPVNSVNEEWYR